MNVKVFSVFLLFISLNILFISCSNNEEDTNQNEINSEQIPDYENGKVIYADNCRTCHQENGEGVPGAFPSLTEKSVDINSVINGVEGSVMISFKDKLNNQEIIDVINFINHSWKNNFNDINIDNKKKIK